MLLGALGLRFRYPELISCPTCGRAKVDLIALAKQVEERLASVPKPLRVAVMGCVVNGPGEAKDADIGDRREGYERNPLYEQSLCSHA